jgi:WD40 repeat protein
VVRPNVDAPPAAPPPPRPGVPVPPDPPDPEKAVVAARALAPLKLPAAAVLAGHADALTGVVFSPDGGRLATTSRDGAIRLWDLTKSEPEKLLDDRAAAGPAGSPAFSPDGTVLAVATNDGAILYDAAGRPARRSGVLPGCTMSVPPGKTPYPEQVLAFMPEGKTLNVAHLEPLENSSDKTPIASFKVWSLDGDEPLLMYTRPGARPEPGHAANVHCIAIAPDLWVAQGGELSVLEWSQLDRLGNAAWGAGHSPQGSAIVGVGFSADGHTQAVTTANGAVEAFFDATKDGKLGRFTGGTGWKKAHAGWATLVGFTPDGKTFVTRGQDRSVVWWTPREATAKAHEWRTPEGTHLWRFSPDGRYAALSIPGERIALVRLPAPFQLP